MKFIELCVIVLLRAALPVQGYCEDSPADREPSAYKEPSANKEPSADKEPSANKEPSAPSNTEHEQEAKS